MLKVGTAATIAVNGNAAFAGIVTVGGNLNVIGDIVYDEITGRNLNITGISTQAGQANFGTSGVGATIFANGNVTVSGILTAAQFSGPFSGSTGTFTGDVLIADKIVHIGDTNTAIRFPAADTFTVETAGSEAARFDSSQRLLLGNTSPRSNAPGADVGFQIEGASGGPTNKRFTQHIFGSGDGSGPYLGLAKHRGTSVGGNTIVVDDDELGGIYFQGADGTNFKQGASILGFVDGTPGSNDMPGRLSFQTTADGASSTTERLRITSAGLVGIATATPRDSAKLDVDGDARFSGKVAVRDGGNAGAGVTIFDNGNIVASGVVTASSFVGGNSITVGSGASVHSGGNAAFVGVVTAGRGFNIGIQSAGIVVAQNVGISTLNFVGSGNSITYHSASNTLGIEISGGSGGVEETSTNVSSTSATGVGSFAVATHRSAAIIAQIDQGANYQVGRYLMIHDGTTATVIEESAIATGSMLGSFTADINNSNAEFKVTMGSSGIATVTTKIDTVTV